MQAGDGTGPMGLGEMTGRQAGYCAGFSMPGYMNPMPGWGLGIGRRWGRGRGWGRGHGWRRGHTPIGDPDPPPLYDARPYHASGAGEQELQALRAQAEQSESRLDEIRRRIAHLGATGGNEG